MERNGDGGGQGKKNGHREEEIPAAEAKPEKKKSDVVKTSKDDADPNPAPEAEKAKKTSSGSSEAKQPVPTTRKGSTGGGSKQFPTPQVLHQKPFQTPQRLLPKVQVATRSRTRSLTAPGFMVSSKGPRLD